jgi:probable HAF family extracellular repeat protein
MTAPHRVCLAALGLAAGGIPAATAVAAPAAVTATYAVTDLGSLGAGVAQGLAINALGQVTGDSVLSKQVEVPCLYPQKAKCFANPDHAFLWGNRTMTDLGTLGGLNSQGVAINRSGEVVGWTYTKNGSKAFLSNAHDHKLIGLSGMTQVHGINDSGRIVGQCGDVVAPEVFACVVSDGTDSALPDSVSGVAVAINNKGEILGRNYDGDNQRALLWTNDTDIPTMLPTLGGAGSTGTAINNLGQVVGTSETGTGAFDGFLWNNGTISDLGNSFAPAAINDSGVIVGGELVYSNGSLQDLNNLIPAGSPYQIQSATGINNNGQIVANANDTATGQDHALLLNPT